MKQIDFFLKDTISLFLELISFQFLTILLKKRCLTGKIRVWAKKSSNSAEVGCFEQIFIGNLFY
jgi:hypothetical protein